MSAYSSIDYKETLFPKPELTKIRGEPTFETLDLLIRELKANARSVHSNLGGGAFGHLGLVVSPPTYALLCNTPFDRPVFPGTAPVIPPNATQHMSNTLTSQFKESLRVYHEVENVDKALKQQLIAAVEPMYLEPMKDRTSDTIVRPLYEVLEYLFDQYGRI